ncbi:putative tricarboxylic transport membrane protein [Caldalkalibacillus uzonensis]|uniref:Tricarboxylic transport membrane protein n=1 Tax=Caldalkalibacillus uzonensis TaxID=353224 RepID=A0ABU0CP61_9BACI|nr:tripartite tricarboxylate transporter permease [Caldalkalibacillus uzonensis]MDQ0338198.1 putative tricarboxylic transport membrane protein [Caldalkalibacillus uzonensis]
MWENLLGGFLSVIEPIHLLVLLSAVFIGFLGGALPGISGTMLVIILLPVTYGMDTISAFLMLTAIYAATVFSGMISAIMFRTPGTPEAVATVFDGYPMAKKGKAGEALGIAIFSSAAGGMIGTLILIFLTPVLSRFALSFSSPEYFALAILGLTVVASLSGGDIIKGFIGVCFGLFIATIGMDTLSGTPRFHFGTSNLMTGVELLSVLIGLFAISEILRRTREDQNLEETTGKIKTRIFNSAIIKKISTTIGRSSLLGTFIGILPGVGATTASMLSYSEAVRWSKHPQKFGTGVPEGIAAPESANNSAAMGALVPLLALGIPGSATTAVILGAFILHGLQPGPNLLIKESSLVYAIFVGLLLVNIMIIVFSKPFIALFTKIMRIPYTVLGPIIIILCMIGTYAVRNSLFDVWVMLLFGIIGFLLEKYRFPIATVILGVVLGPIAESEFRRGLQMAGGDYSVFFTRPISATLLIIAILVIALPIFKSLFKSRTNQTGQISS